MPPSLLPAIPPPAGSASSQSGLTFPSAPPPSEHGGRGCPARVPQLCMMGKAGGGGGGGRTCKTYLRAEGQYLAWSLDCFGSLVYIHRRSLGWVPIASAQQAAGNHKQAGGTNSIFQVERCTTSVNSVVSHLGWMPGASEVRGLVTLYPPVARNVADTQCQLIATALDKLAAIQRMLLPSGLVPHL